MSAARCSRCGKAFERTSLAVGSVAIEQKLCGICVDRRMLLELEQRKVDALERIAQIQAQLLEHAIEQTRIARDMRTAMGGAPPVPGEPGRAIMPPPGTAICPGDLVELAHKPPPMLVGSLTRDVKAGDLGRVVRLVHHAIEGAPLERPTDPTLVHVLFEGQTQVLGFEPACLRKLAPPLPSDASNVRPLRPKDRQ